MSGGIVAFGYLNYGRGQRLQEFGDFPQEFHRCRNFRLRGNTKFRICDGVIPAAIECDDDQHRKKDGIFFAEGLIYPSDCVYLLSRAECLTPPTGGTRSGAPPDRRPGESDMMTAPTTAAAAAAAMNLKSAAELAAFIDCAYRAQINPLPRMRQLGIEATYVAGSYSRAEAEALRVAEIGDVPRRAYRDALPCLCIPAGDGYIVLGGRDARREVLHRIEVNDCWSGF